MCMHLVNKHVAEDKCRKIVLSLKSVTIDLKQKEDINFQVLL